MEDCPFYYKAIVGPVDGVSFTVVNGLMARGRREVRVRVNMDLMIISVLKF